AQPQRAATPTSGMAGALTAQDALIGQPVANGPVGGEAPPGLPAPLPTTVSPALATVLADLPATLPALATRPVPTSRGAVPAARSPEPGSDLVVGPPSLSATMIDTVLECYKSPAAGLGARFYADGAQYAIDPAYGLAWFINMSKGGTRGIAPTIKSIGNFHAL